MTHRDASRTPASRGHANRAMPAVRRPAPTGAQRGGFTESELDLIHATAEANGQSICICTAVVPDGTFPPTPDGAPRPEVARILASLRKNTEPGARPAGSGALAARAADRSAGAAAERPDVGAERAVRSDAAAPSRAAAAVAYDRQAHELEIVRRPAIASDTTAEADLEAVTADAPETHRG